MTERIDWICQRYAKDIFGKAEKGWQVIEGRGKENIFLFVVFWNLFGPQTDPEFKYLGRLAKLRREAESLGIDGLGFLAGLYLLQEKSEFHRLENTEYMNAMPVRVLDYLTATITNKRKCKRERERTDTLETYDAVEAIFARGF